MKSYRRRARAAVLLFLRSMLSFRVLMALTTSASVTASVAGPMAYQANKAREEMAITAAAPTTTVAPIPPTTSRRRPDPTDPAPTTTTPTTTTTAPGATTTVPIPTTAGPTVPGETTTTIPPVTSEGLFVSQRADHSVPEALNSARVGRRVWVFFDAPDVQRVRYWIDNPSGAGEPDRVSTTPFDLGVNGFDFTTFSEGPHSLLAEVLTVSGSTYQRFAQFTVRNN